MKSNLLKVSFQVQQKQSGSAQILFSCHNDMKLLHEACTHIMFIWLSLLQCIAGALPVGSACFCHSVCVCVIHSSLSLLRLTANIQVGRCLQWLNLCVCFFNMSTIRDEFRSMYRHSNTAYGNGTAHTTQLHSQSTHSMHEFQSGTLKMNIQ